MPHREGKKSPWEFISGRHSVLSVLKNKRRRINKLVLQKDLPPVKILDDIRMVTQQRNVPLEETSKITLERRFSLSGRSHQGVVLLAQAYPYGSLEDLNDWLSQTQHISPIFLLILDHLHDPHNVGALIRSAELAGCQGVVLPQDRSCQVTPTVVKTSVGASELLSIYQVPNLNRLIELLNHHQVLTVGLDTGEPHSIYQTDFTGPVALVVGNEQKGIAQLTRKKCQRCAFIPMHGQTASLNASVAGGIGLFEVARQRAFRYEAL